MNSLLLFFPPRPNGNLTDSPWGLMYHLLGRNKLPPALGWKETQCEVLCLSLPHTAPCCYVEVVTLVCREQEAKVTDTRGDIWSTGLCLSQQVVQQVLSLGSASCLSLNTSSSTQLPRSHHRRALIIPLVSFTKQVS